MDERNIQEIWLRKFHASLVAVNLAEREPDPKSQAASSKTQCTNQAAPETAKETMLAEMRLAGYVINVSNE